MKAITFDSYGSPDVLQITDLPDPQAGPGQVRVRIKAAGVDAALDAAGRGALEASVDLIADRDRIVTLVDFDRVRELGVRGIRSRRSVYRLRRLVDLYAKGKLKIHFRKTFPFSQVAGAHREVEIGHGRGKVVLFMADGNQS